jgi:uncharacterized protein (TIGR00369 family)
VTLPSPGHSATIRWSAPAPLYAALREMRSIDIFRAMLTGTMPMEPAMAAIGVALVAIEPGRVVMALDTGPRHQDHTGFIQTAILAAMADTAAGYAVHTELLLGDRAASVELHVEMIRPIAAEGRILCVGRADQIGERVALCSAELFDPAGALQGRMGMTMMILPRDAARDPEGIEMADGEIVERQLTVSWSDPAILRGVERRLPWIDILRGMLSGEMPVPPSFALLGFVPVSVEPGEVSFALDPAEQHYNLIACVHGGILSALCDTAAGLAVHTRLPHGKTCTTLELHVNFIRPVSLDSGRATCTGRVIHLGGRTATAEARITDAKGRLCAHMGTTLMVLDIA